MFAISEGGGIGARSIGASDDVSSRVVSSHGGHICDRCGHGSVCHGDGDCTDTMRWSLILLEEGEMNK